MPENGIGGAGHSLSSLAMNDVNNQIVQQLQNKRSPLTPL